MLGLFSNRITSQELNPWLWRLAVARSGCLYGPTGSYKTTQVKRLAHYIAKKTGKATYLLSLDGGGWDSCTPEVRAGMILPYRRETANLPLVILRKISQGYW